MAVPVAVLATAVAGSLSSCTTTARSLPAIPTLGHGGAAGAAAAPAIAVPSPGAVEYQMDGSLPGLADRGTVYRAGATADPSELTRLASAVGLSASPQEDGSGWTVTDGDRRLHVDRVGGLPWTFSSSGTGTGSSGCAVAVPGSPGGDQPTTSTPPVTCPPTTTVPGLPDRAGAERYARDFLSRAGLDVTGATVGATGGSDGWTVTFSPALDGLPVLGGATSVTLGAHGVVAAASGKLAPPVDSGSYPLVGVAAAIDRLRHGWDWIVYSGPVPLAAGGGAVPVEPPSTSPQPTTPATTAAPRIVKITAAHLALAWAWPVAPRSDTAWLVPVYVFALGPGSPYPFLGGGVPVLGVADAYVTGR